MRFFTQKPDDTESAAKKKKRKKRESSCRVVNVNCYSLTGKDNFEEKTKKEKQSCTQEKKQTKKAAT